MVFDFTDMVTEGYDDYRLMQKLKSFTWQFVWLFTPSYLTEQPIDN